MDEVSVIKRVEKSISLNKHLIEEAHLLVIVARLLVDAFRRGNKLLIFGNGGSAADAQHIATELSGKLYRDRKSLPVIDLTANTSLLTAIANDYGYDMVFTRQLQGLLENGDIVLGMSTSGESKNIINAMEEANRWNVTKVAFCGRGGKLTELVDYALIIPSNDTARIQETHIIAAHIICELVESEFSKIV